MIEAHQNMDGMVRLLVADGWVSIRASDGTQLLRPAPAGLREVLESCVYSVISRIAWIYTGCLYGYFSLQDVTNLARPAEYGIFQEIDSDDDGGLLLPPPAPPRTTAQKAAEQVRLI